MNGEQLLKQEGYKQQSFLMEDMIMEYTDGATSIYFDLETHSITPCFRGTAHAVSLKPKEIMAISQLCKDLGW